MRQELVEQTSIFDFDNYRDYLVACGLPEGKYGHTSRNLQNWANRLGYKSASSLSMVLTGERFPSKDMIERLAQDFKLSSRERRYFELSIQLDRARKKGRDTGDIESEIKKLVPEKTHFSIGLSEFKVISEWYVIAVKQLIDTESFVEDLDWIHKRLRKKVTLSQIKCAINSLLELGIVKRDEAGRLRVARAGLITSNDIPSSAIKKHHYGMLQRAQDALMEQGTEERQINSTTMRIKKEKLPEAKKVLFDFLKEFSTKFQDDASDEIFQLNMQLFQLTKEVRQQ